MSDLDKALDSLTAKQRELFMMRLRRLEEKKEASFQAQIKPQPRDTGPIPLSYAQERMWFLSQLDPGGAGFNLFSAIQITGHLNVSALEGALNELVRRHEVLRTSIRAELGLPVQVIAPALDFHLSVVNLESLEPAACNSELRRRAEEENLRPFDLEHAPLWRVTLLRLTAHEHAVFLTMHHIISDGWSMSLLLRELVTMYESIAGTNPSPLSPLEIQYADFAIAQRQWLQGDTLEAHLAHWRQALSAPLPVMNLPTDRPRAAARSFKTAVQPLLLPAPLTDALNTLSRRENTTLFMTLLAAFSVLLSRYLRQEDVLIGTPIAGRNRAEIEGLIGFFLNTLPLRVTLDGDPTCRQLLARVREVTLAAYAHQDVPFEMLMKELRLDRELDRTAPFRVIFLLQNFPAADLAGGGLSMRLLDTEGIADLGTAVFDLTLMMEERGDALYGSITYNALLFDGVTIARMIGHLQTLLENMSADPDQVISRHSVIGAAEQKQILSWSRASSESRGELPVPRLFERQAARSPETVAIVQRSVELSYGELNRRANQLARHLRRASGVGPEGRVGIYMERTPERLIALMGTLKAGGAYVPLAQRFPKDRLGFMLEDAGVPVVLTTSHLVAKLRDQPTKLVCLDEEWPAIGLEDGADLEDGPAPENAAYVIFTSGSTGKPKGVIVPHRCLAHYVETARRLFDLEPADRVLQFAPISFDTSAEEIFPCLAAGATLVLRTDEMLASVSHFLAACQEGEITVLNLPTAYWHEIAAALAAQEAASAPPTLRLVIIGGERAMPERLAQWRQSADSRIQIINTYGPTEATIVATTYAPPALLDDSLREIPIGRPIAGVRAYILDERMQLTPVGVPGELYLGGTGVSRGYLNRPSLTAERFVPDPHADVPGARLYRTGDLARYLPDGNLEFAGRVDDQVKIRGYRIELPEIESALLEHAAVEEAVVLAREDLPGDRRLVAYLVMRTTVSPQPSISELRQFLERSLPDYMVPMHFVPLATFPRGVSGKVDRRALPAPDQTRPDLAQPFVAPRTPTEETLVRIWSEILHVDQVGVLDSFFDLGGHSLLLPRVLHRVREAFQVEVPLRTLFDDPTIACLALTVEEIMLDEIERLSEEDAGHRLGEGS